MTVTPEYLQRLKLRDFLGELSEEEIPIAKAHGVFKWDSHIKARRANASLHTGGER